MTDCVNRRNNGQILGFENLMNIVYYSSYQTCINCTSECLHVSQVIFTTRKNDPFEKKYGGYKSVGKKLD